MLAYVNRDGNVVLTPENDLERWWMRLFAKDPKRAVRHAGTTYSGGAPISMLIEVVEPPRD